MPTTTTLSRSPPSSHPRATGAGGKHSPSSLPAMAYPSLPSHRYTSPPPSTKSGRAHHHRHHRDSSGAGIASSSAVPSLVSDSGSGSGGMSDVDLLDMLDLKLSDTVKPERLDRGIAKQAQGSGELNAKNRELAELQALASRRLKGARANFADGQKAAKEVKRDLEWTQKKVNTLKTKTEKRYPEQYRKAHARYPSPGR